MIEPNIYCKVSGMTMRCIAQLNAEGVRLPVVVEVGCADGQGTMRYAGFCAKTVAVDAMLPGRPDITLLGDGRVCLSEHGHESIFNLNEIAVDNQKIDIFRRRTQELNVDLVVGFSTNQRVVDEVRDSLIWGPKASPLADIVVIDGCHHPFEAVWEDVMIYHQFVRPGGFMILDDLYEECIEQAYQKAIAELGYEPFDRWRVATPQILQEAAAIRRLP